MADILERVQIAIALAYDEDLKIRAVALDGSDYPAAIALPNALGYDGVIRAEACLPPTLMGYTLERAGWKAVSHLDCCDLGGCRHAVPI